MIAYGMSTVTTYFKLQRSWNMVLEYSTSSKASKQQFLSLKYLCCLLNTFNTVMSNSLLSLKHLVCFSSMLILGEIIFTSHEYLRLLQRYLVCPKAGSASIWISKSYQSVTKSKGVSGPDILTHMRYEFPFGLLKLPEFAVGLFYFSSPKSEMAGSLSVWRNFVTPVWIPGKQN